MKVGMMQMESLISVGSVVKGQKKSPERRKRRPSADQPRSDLVTNQMLVVQGSVQRLDQNKRIGILSPSGIQRHDKGQRDIDLAQGAFSGLAHGEPIVCIASCGSE